MLWKLLAADIECFEGIGAVGTVLFLTSSCFFSIIISVILSAPDNFNLFLALGFLFQVQYLTLCNLLHNHYFLYVYYKNLRKNIIKNITKRIKPHPHARFDISFSKLDNSVAFFFDLLPS